MTIELSKTQIEALQSGAAHDAGHIAIPKTLRGGARQKVVTGLVTARLAAYRAGSLVITTTGMAAIGATNGVVESKPSATKPPKKAKPADGDQPRKSRDGTKQARLIEMLKRPEGVTIDEVVKTLDWQAHTVRGAMAGALKKKLGLSIESEKVDQRGRVYRIVE